MTPGSGRLRLGGATMLVTANMVGTGIFLLPVSMASVGSISTLGWLVGAIGAGAIGMMFAQLGAVDPQPGGPYAYARNALGPYLGFQTNYVYWTANLVGNIAVATTITGYVTPLLPFLEDPLYRSCFSAGVIWMATGINIVGPGFVGAVAGWTAALALIPLVAVGGFGWFWFDSQTFLDGWNPHQRTPFAAISESASYALWAFMGIESASVAAGVIENPKRNIPLATLLGLLIATLLYISTCTVLLGIIPANELATMPDPFVAAALRTVGSVGAVVIGVCAVMKTSASLVGWTLTISQSAQAAAADRMFPSLYGRTNRHGVPVYNLVLSACLMTVIVFATASPTLAQQFSEIIDIAVVLTILPYLHSAVALYVQNDRSPAGGRVRLFWAVVGGVVCLYGLWAVAGSDAFLVRGAMIVLFLSVPLYLFFLRGIGNRSTDGKNG